MFSRFQIVNFISKFSFFIVIICSMNPFKILLIFGKFACTHCPISCFKKRKIILKNSDYFANFSIFLRSTRQKSHGNWKNDLFFWNKMVRFFFLSFPLFHTFNIGFYHRRMGAFFFSICFRSLVKSFSLKLLQSSQ